MIADVSLNQGAPPLHREGAARHVGLGRCPGVWLVPGPVPPLLWAVGRPRLLFPRTLLRQLDHRVVAH